MAHFRFPAHIGVWLKPEARVIHCSERHGVCCESVLALRQIGWKKLTFYEPIVGKGRYPYKTIKRAVYPVLTLLELATPRASPSPQRR